MDGIGKAILDSAFINTCVGAFLGIYLSNMNESRKRKFDAENRKAILLRNLYDEICYNDIVLRRVSEYIQDGPDIDHLWSPAVTTSSYLQDEAWKELVTSGMHQTLDRGWALELHVTAIAIVDVKRIMAEIEMNWYRVSEWHQHDIQEDNQRLTQRKLYKEQALQESKDRVGHALELISISKLSISHQLSVLEKRKKILGRIGLKSRKKIGNH